MSWRCAKVVKAAPAPYHKQALSFFAFLVELAQARLTKNIGSE
jgi:hypothetical protein